MDTPMEIDPDELSHLSTGTLEQSAHRLYRTIFDTFLYSRDGHIHKDKIMLVSDNGRQLASKRLLPS